MRNKKRALAGIITLVLTTVLISACTQSLSQAPEATPTVIETGLFVSPFPSVENPMAMIEEFAQQTSVAQTAAAGGTTGTPAAITTGSALTPQAGTESPTAEGAVTTPGTPTNAVAVATTPAVAVTPGGPTSTPVPVGVRPATYTLLAGEHPFCIARRYNVDPDQLLSLSGLSRDQADNLSVGTVLKVPQSGSFPGTRSLTSHPTTYSVLSADETLNSIACKFGDVDPSAIATANNIAVSAKLTAGQKLQIP